MHKTTIPGKSCARRLFKTATFKLKLKTLNMKRIASILFLALLAFSCSELKQSSVKSDELNQSKTENLQNLKGQIATFLTFQKEDAEQAMNFYIGLFDNSEIVNLNRWGKDEPGKEGTIMHATFTLNGKLFMCSDSPPIHEWDFTPAVSIYVECKDENETEHLFTKLSENGKVMMPLNNYGFSRKFGFVEDRFGVSWQLNLE